MLLLVDSTEHLFFSFEFAKPFGSTQFLRSKYQYGSEFSQIGTPHFSLEGVQSFSSTQSNKFYRVLGSLQHLRRHHGHTVKHDALLKKSIERTPEKALNWNSERCVFRMSKLTFMAYLLSKRGLGTTEPLVRTREPKNVEVRSFLGLVNVSS